MLKSVQTKTLVCVLRQVLTSCTAIIEKGGVGGQENKIFLSRERFFCTPRQCSCGLGGGCTQKTSEGIYLLQYQEFNSKIPKIFFLKTPWQLWLCEAVHVLRVCFKEGCLSQIMHFRYEVVLKFPKLYCLEVREVSL